jgi:hypothetical protein
MGEWTLDDRDSSETGGRKRSILATLGEPFFIGAGS